MDSALIITVVAIAVLGPIFTLLWWKIADQWADAERRRFKPKGSQGRPEQRVITGFPKAVDSKEPRS